MDEIGASTPSSRSVTASTSYWPSRSIDRAVAQSRASSAFTSGAVPRLRIDVPSRTSRSGSGNGSGFSSTLSITLTIAVVAPIPSVIASTTASDTTGVRPARRAA